MRKRNSEMAYRVAKKTTKSTEYHCLKCKHLKAGTYEIHRYKWLQNEYPEMKFKIVDDEIKQNFTKYANCTLSIDKDADLKIWKNPVIVHLSTEQKYGHWCGMGEAVNSFEELEEQLALYIECCKNHAKGYAAYRKERRLQDE